MAVSTSELSLVYGSVTVGGSTARQITDWTRDEHDYERGSFEFEFVTTTVTEDAFQIELDAIRDEFRKPRLDLVVTQGSKTILSRKHSNNTGLDTAPTIVKDGDPADTGRSRHFRVRIAYDLPADNVSTNFRRGATIRVEYSPARRRTVTISGIYTANSSDGTTTSDAQYLAQIASAETTLLNTVDSTAIWERTGQPQIEYFETRKLCRFTRVYREVNVAQALGASNDDTNIIDPHLEITVQQVAPGDSIEGSVSLGANSGSTLGSTQVMGADKTTAGVSDTIVRPIVITATYDAAINFDGTTDLRALWLSTVRPWIINRIRAHSPGTVIVIIDEQPAYEIYENHIGGSMQCVGYTTTMLRQRITYEDMTMHGRILEPVTGSDPFSYYDFQGPAVRQMIVTEEREQLVSTTNARSYVMGLYASPGSTFGALGDRWVLVSRNPKTDIRVQGLSGANKENVATTTIVTIFQFRNRKRPSTANAGGVTGIATT